MSERMLSRSLHERLDLLNARIRLFLRGGSAGQIGWNMVATLASQGSTFAATIALARLLSATDFGVYVVVLSTAQIATQVAAAGMGYTATRYIAEFSRSDPRKASRVFGFCLGWSCAAAVLLGSFITVASPWLADQVFNAPALAQPLRYAGFICLFMTVNAIITGALAGLGQFKALGLASVLAGAVYLLCTATLSAWWGVTGAGLGLALSAATQTALLAIALRRARSESNVYPDVAHAMAERSVLMRFALPAALAGLSAAIALWLGQLILTRDAGLVQIGLYSVANNLLTIALLAPNVINTVGMSTLNQARGAGDAPQFERLFKANLRITFVAAAAMATLIAASSPWLLRVFGPDFSAALPALLVLLLAALPESLGLAHYQILQSRERMWQAMRLVVLPRDLSLPLAALLLVPHFGALGLAAAYLLSRAIYFVSTRYAAHRGAPSPTTC